MTVQVRPALLPALLLAFAAALGLVPGTGRAQGLPQQFTADYALSTGGMEIGATRRTLRPAGGGAFVFESSSSPKGIASLFVSQQLLERSQWEYHDGRLRTLDYLKLRHGGEKQRRLHIRFDWSTHTAFVDSDGKRSQYPVPDATLDALNFQLALMQDLRQGKTRFTYAIADRRKVKTYDIRTVGHERVETPLGAFQAIKLEQVGQSNERGLTVWCAAALDFLPVRIDYREEDGRVYRATLHAVTGVGRH